MERKGRKDLFERTKEKKRVELENILLVTRNFGVTNAASEDVQNREGKMDNGQSKNKLQKWLV